MAVRYNFDRPMSSQEQAFEKIKVKKFTHKQVNFVIYVKLVNFTVDTMAP
jgi:hypothetical protein